MEISGSQVIQADRSSVWSALNDADVLRLCIPGCEVLERISDDEMSASV
ncbi:SRPBCC domain-containing protein, partial [uncultured Roseibium sp.]